jgi:hypothetical protein
MRREAVVALMAWSLMGACGVSADTDTDDTDTDDTDIGDTDIGDTDDGCDGGAACDIVVENAAVVGCESDSGTIPSLSVNQTGPGALDITHYSARTGCCPEFSASAELDSSAKTLTVSYAFENDLCDCICALDVSYSLVDVPAGTWTLKTSNLDQEVTVE